MGWLDDLIRRVPRERQEALREAAIGRPPNSIDVGEFSPGRAIANRRRIANRNMNELIGMCRMVLADGAVEEYEARLLLDSIEKGYLAIHEWPGNVLYERIISAMADGRIDPDEESELLDVIHKISGGLPNQAGPAISGAIPFDEPAPAIVFPEHDFVITGQFVYGSRTIVSAAITEHGGRVKSNCSGKVEYLVVGTYGSDEWLHSTHGTKIRKAVELKQAGKPLAIVTERHWTSFIR